MHGRGGETALSTEQGNFAYQRGISSTFHVPLFDLKSLFLRPDLPSECRRAQVLSGMAAQRPPRSGAQRP
jgi:hypothetical protein